MKVRDVIRLIEGYGWQLDRQRGSHRIYRHPHRRGIVIVAGKPSADLPVGTLGNIMHQAGLRGSGR